MSFNFQRLFRKFYYLREFLNCLLKPVLHLNAPQYARKSAPNFSIISIFSLISLNYLLVNVCNYLLYDDTSFVLGVNH